MCFFIDYKVRKGNVFVGKQFVSFFNKSVHKRFFICKKLTLAQFEQKLKHLHTLSRSKFNLLLKTI